MITVVACPHPLRDVRHVFAVGGRPTVEDLVCEAAQRGQVPLSAMRNAVVVIGDRLIEKPHWKHTRPKAGPVVIKTMPAAFAAPLLVSAAGFAASSAVSALGLSALATGLIQAGIGLVTSLLTTALAPSPSQRSLGREESAPASYSIQGVRNEARPYGVIPRVYGRRVNYYPLLAALPYTELWSGEQQYTRMLFDVGYGPLAISDLKIGDQAITTLKNTDYQVREGYPTDQPITLYSSQVREQAFSIELQQVSGFTAKTTEPDTDEVTLDIVFPNGLQRVTDRNVKLSIRVAFEVQIRLSSGSPWQHPVLTQESGGVVISAGGRFEIEGNTKAAIRRSIGFPVTRGQWDVQVRRITIDDQSDNVGDNQSITQEKGYWTAIRSHHNEPPTTTTGIARIAVRAQATDQLSGVIEQLNCTVVSVLPVWTGSLWVEQATRNPAWVYCDILRGSANRRAVADSRIDLPAMLAWAAWCDANGFTFDGVFDRRQSVFECLQEVAATACASPTMRDGKYSIVVDNTRDTVVQHFTPRNLRSFEGQKVFAQTPHAVKVIYFPEVTQHQAAELYVYDDGYSAANATLFETLELPYTTSAAAAFKRGRRALFSMKLRPEIYSAVVDIEYIVCTRGDLVRVTHDVPMWGLHGARVKALVTAGADTTGVVLDAPVTMAGGASYGLRVRQSTTATYAIATVAGEQTTLTLASPVATASGPAVGDLVMFGELGAESVELVVRSVEPLNDVAARLTFVDYAPAIQTSDSGAVPEHDPQITTPPAVNRPRPPKPAILSIASDEAALIRASDGTLLSRILIGISATQSGGLVAAEAIQARFRPAATTQPFTWLGALPAQAGEISVLPVEDRATYEIQLRSVSQAGAVSEWTEITHTVIGKTTPPPSVERFYRQGNALIWPYPNAPADLAGFLVRANYGTSTDWGMARALHPGVVASPPFDISGLHGTQTILIKAVDTSGIESATAATVTIDLGDLRVSNVVVTQSEAPGWGGTLTGGTDTGTDIEATLLSSPPFWGEDGARFWGADGDLFWAANTYDSMVYTATYTPTTDILGDGLLKVDTTVVGAHTIDYRISTSGTFWGADGDPFWGADSDLFWAADTIGEWLPFPGALGPFDTTADSYQFRLTTAGGPVQGIASQPDIVIDVPDITENFEDVVISAASTRLTLTKTYRAIKVVNLTVQTDGNGGISARIIDKNETLGPDVEVLNAAGTAVIGLIDGTIIGY